MKTQRTRFSKNLLKKLNAWNKWYHLNRTLHLNFKLSRRLLTRWALARCRNFRKFNSRYQRITKSSYVYRRKLWRGKERKKRNWRRWLRSWSRRQSRAEWLNRKVSSRRSTSKCRAVWKHSIKSRTNWNKKKSRRRTNLISWRRTTNRCKRKWMGWRMCWLRWNKNTSKHWTTLMISIVNRSSSVRICWRLSVFKRKS
jgi:hypothetical protein